MAELFQCQGGDDQVCLHCQSSSRVTFKSSMTLAGTRSGSCFHWASLPPAALEAHTVEEQQTSSLGFKTLAVFQQLFALTALAGGQFLFGRAGAELSRDMERWKCPTGFGVRQSSGDLGGAVY